MSILGDLNRMSIVQYLALRVWRWERVRVLEGQGGAPRVEIRRHVATGSEEAWFFIDSAENGLLRPYSRSDVPKLLAEWRGFIADVETGRRTSAVEAGESGEPRDDHGRAVGPLMARKRLLAGGPYLKFKTYEWKTDAAQLGAWMDAVEHLCAARPAAAS